jgi:hypothetical protein
VNRLLLDERILADGSHARTWASIDGTEKRIRIAEDESPGGVLSFDAIDRVMTRYAKPLDHTVLGLLGDALDIGDGRRLRRLRYRAAVDVEGRDYLVWERPGEPPIAVIATMCTAALRYLVLRLGAESPQKTEGADGEH